MSATRPPITHHLKIHPVPFGAVLAGVKTYEIRVNDRDFRVGDRLWLKEWDPATETWTGANVLRSVLYMTRGGEWGLPDDLCVMAIGRVS